MPEPLSDDQLEWLRGLAHPNDAPDPDERIIDLSASMLGDIVAEIDRLRLANGASAIGFSSIVTKLADLEAEVERLREENTALGVRWREQHDRAETAEDDVLRAITERNEVARIAAAEIHPGPDGADDEIRRELIRSWLDEGRDDAEGWREMFQRAVLKPCPHIVRDEEGTAFCDLDYTQVERLRTENAELRAEVNQLTAERDDLYDTIGTNADAAASQAAYEGWLSGRNGVDRG